MRITESQLRRVIKGILAEQAEQSSGGLEDMIAQYKKDREERVASAPTEPLPVTSIPKRGKMMDVARAMETWIISHFPELRGEFLATRRPTVRWGSNVGALGGFVEPQAVVETKGKFNEVWDLMQREIGPQQTYNRNVVGGNDPVDYIPWGGFIFTKMRGGSGMRIGISTKDVRGMKK